MTETFILQLIILLLAGIFGFVIIKMIYTLLVQDKNEKKINTALTEIGKIKSNFKKVKQEIMEEIPEPNELPYENILEGFLSKNATLQDLAKQFGLEKELNNPIVKPIAEKLFKQVKEKAGQKENTNIDDIGY